MFCLNYYNVISYDNIPLVLCPRRSSLTLWSTIWHSREKKVVSVAVSGDRNKIVWNNLLAGFMSATILNQFCLSANFMSLIVLRAVMLSLYIGASRPHRLIKIFPLSDIMDLRHQSNAMCIIMLGGEDTHPWSATNIGNPILAPIPVDQ